ncbi:4861_t:CDS:1 [Acaulospora colombiana]|uniref:4861_t:CDS:1 n=1 Tax=Acaulospora colombiana TaxID=27376 RepID=A0ACA9KCP7_9GLOM|nr:4861_t:CDS:1 [Acaulospora colombiana]
MSQARLPRLRRELVELHNESMKGIDVILHEDITSMCLILTPLQGPFNGLRLHLSVCIPEEYPRLAPQITIQTPVQHPNVFGNFICADILQAHGDETQFRSSRGYNGGYTPGYLLKYIFLQLLSFFSDTRVEQTGGHKYDIAYLEDSVHKNEMRNSVTNYKCNKCGFNDSINVTPTQAEIEELDICGNPINSTQNFDNIIPSITPNATVDKLTDDCWLHIIEFLNERDIFVLSSVYPRIHTLVHFFNILLRRQLVCFYLRKTFTESILGIGIRVGNNRDVEKRELIINEFDLFSYESFNSHHLRNGIWGDSFTHFLPVALNLSHFNRALPIIQRTLVELRSFGAWNPKVILKTIPGLMNTAVVSLMKTCDDSGERSSYALRASEKALQGYCLLLHLLTMLSEKYPEVIEEAENKVEGFIKNQNNRSRNKTVTPNLGEFIAYLFMCKNISWSRFCPCFLEELLSRNVVWFLNSNASLAYLEPEQFISNYRLSETFELSKVSLRLVMFQVAFLKMTRDTRNDMDRRYGYPTEEMSNSLLQLIKQIYQVNTWDVFFKMIDFELPEKDWEPIVLKLLRNAIVDSGKSGYHQMPYTVNEVYFLRRKFEPSVPAPPSWRPNDKTLQIHGFAQNLSFHAGERARRDNESKREFHRHGNRGERGRGYNYRGGRGGGNNYYRGGGYNNNRRGGN